jgi:hypothetical protein
MATRSLIGIKLNDNIVKTIYCHWDGYPEHNGKLLVENYNTPAAILGLLELGDLSTLAETPAKCSAYHRDRKEPYGMVEARDMDGSTLIEDAVNDYGVDYVYIYNNEYEWECSRLDYASGKLTPLDILSNIALN